MKIDWECAHIILHLQQRIGGEQEVEAEEAAEATHI